MKTTTQLNLLGIDNNFVNTQTQSTNQPESIHTNTRSRQPTRFLQITHNAQKRYEDTTSAK